MPIDYRQGTHTDKIRLYEKYIMDEPKSHNIGDFFDTWALNGKHLSMEKGHSKTVNKFLKSIDFADSFSFLDVGCGNGWVVRAMAENTKCSRALGIDVSAGMIKTAKSKSTSKKEAYLHTGIESYKGCMFDYVFSMESLYYVKSISDAVRAIWHVLKPWWNVFLWYRLLCRKFRYVELAKINADTNAFIFQYPSGSKSFAM